MTSDQENAGKVKEAVERLNAALQAFKNPPVAARPTIAELEAILAAPDPPQMSISVDGEVHIATQVRIEVGDLETLLSALAKARGDVQPLWDHIHSLEAKLTKAGERIAEHLAAYNREWAIVDRIWTQLGRPTFEELAGRSIYDLIDTLKARAEAAEAQLAEREKANGVVLSALIETQAQLAEARRVIEFYRDGFQYHPKRTKTGINLSEWKPKKALLDDCGEIARAFLTTLAEPEKTP